MLDPERQVALGQGVTLCGGDNPLVARERNGATGGGRFRQVRAGRRLTTSARSKVIPGVGRNVPCTIRLVIVVYVAVDIGDSETIRMHMIALATGGFQPSSRARRAVERRDEAGTLITANNR